ncbi:hypothetical protein TWF694_008667 [Orbilia ellipsospora]|uniref:Transmembrane protein 135 N-terminal domain-containing protein n=1 Tax=Orbilia ellipsospora TaxID=2528407 RepID=A0AAV9XD48_9PEZI
MSTILGYFVSPQELQHIKKISASNAQKLSKQRRSQTESGLTSDDTVLKQSIRLGGRIFIIGSSILTVVDTVRSRAYNSRGIGPWSKRLNIRIPLSLSLLLLLHRLCYRTAIRLQSKVSSLNVTLAAPSGKLKKIIMSPMASSFAAALSGIVLVSIPSDNARLSISVYIFAKTMEYLSNALYVSGRVPWWFGSWLLFPLSFSQLFHTFLTGGESVPYIYKKAITTFPIANESNKRALDTLSTSRRTTQMNEVARLGFPAFHSGILFPQKALNQRETSSVTWEAHPAIVRLSCAIAHPKTVSCFAVYLKYIVQQLGKNSRIFFAIYSISFLSKLRSFGIFSLAPIADLLRKTIKTSSFVTLAVASSWSAICLLQRIGPKNILNHNSFYISGFLGGLMAFCDREGGHPIFLDAARSAAISWWKVHRNSKYLRRIPSPEAIILIISIATLNILYDANPNAITSKGARKMIELLRGPGRIEDPSSEMQIEQQTLHPKINTIS